MKVVDWDSHGGSVGKVARSLGHDTRTVNFTEKRQKCERQHPSMKIRNTLGEVGDWVRVGIGVRF
jgi:hypothetical protein